jgi:lon-related putative ATP-dependent protease
MSASNSGKSTHPRAAAAGGSRKRAGKAPASKTASAKTSAPKAVASARAGVPAAARPVDITRFALPAKELTWRCDLKTCGFSSTAEVPDFEGIIGQDRAIAAIQLGLKMRSKGYNIYVAGLPGTGKMTTVKHLLATIDTGRGVPPDIVYVNSFADPDRPRAIQLPAGQGRRLKRDMEMLVINMRRNIVQIYESDVFKDRMKAMVEDFKEREKALLHAFEDHIRRESFALIQVQMGPFSKPEIAPVIAGEPVQIEKLESLTHQQKFSQEEFDRLKLKYEDLTAEMERAFKAARDLKRELRDAMAKIQKQFGSPAVTDYIKDLKAVYDHPDVLDYLAEVQEAILDNMERFTEDGETDEEKQNKEGNEKREPRFRDFTVNVLVDNSKTKTPPVVIETSPNYRNLFGTIERTVERTGHWVSDFTKIKAGSFLLANGGVLVLNLMDAIVEPGVWVTLKRALKHRKIDIQTFDPFYVLSVSALKPEPIALDVKVVVLGDRMAYHLLYNLDEDFRKIFKVKAEFDTQMPRTKNGVDKYINFARKITSEEGLLPLEASGVARLVEHGVRLAGRRTKLSTQFSVIADVIREADLWAREAGATLIGVPHVEQALENRRERLNLVQERIREALEEGLIFIDTDGVKVGQVNGLSVMDLGDFAFGQPARITVKVSLGRDGIVNIEREAEMSGKTHNKGVLILEGYIRSLFAQDKPLALNASICFEQNYGGIDGDSASSTEIYGLISALSGIALRQDVAVTGSVDQHGDIQPIGGVNEKVEAFFDLCAKRGLTGQQGVMIPATNVEDLMLRANVVAAVAQGKFHLWAIRRIEEGIEILTGQPAGECTADGCYPEGTVFGAADRRIDEFARLLQDFGTKQNGKDS